MLLVFLAAWYYAAAVIVGFAWEVPTRDIVDEDVNLVIFDGSGLGIAVTAVERRHAVSEFEKLWGRIRQHESESNPGFGSDSTNNITRCTW